MGVSLRLFVDYTINGTAFADGEYDATKLRGDGITASEISRIQNVWKDLEKYSNWIKVSMQVLTFPLCFVVVLTIPYLPNFLNPGTMAGSAMVMGIFALPLFAFMVANKRQSEAAQQVWQWKDAADDRFPVLNRTPV